MLSRMTVAIVDDDAAVRESLGALLISMGQKVRTYNSGSTFLNDHNRKNCDCILMDVTMPGMSGLEVQRRLSEAGDSTPILIVTGNADIPMAVQAMQAGALDVVEKPYRDTVILEKVESALSTAATQRRQKQRRAEIQHGLSRLTPREHDVLKYLEQGLQNKAIARELEISHRTVEIYRSRVMQKMQAPSLANLVAMLIEVGYEPPDALVERE